PRSATSPTLRRRAPGLTSRSSVLSCCPMICRFSSPDMRRGAKGRSVKHKTRPRRLDRGSIHFSKLEQNRPKESKAMKARSVQTVDERNTDIREEIAKIIDGQAEAVARDNPGVPAGVVRNLLTARAPACPCAQYLELRREP